MRRREHDLLCDWLGRDFEPDLAARFHTTVSEARSWWTASLLGRGGRRVSAAGRTGLRVRGARSLGKPVEAASGRREEGEAAGGGCSRRGAVCQVRGVLLRRGPTGAGVVPSRWSWRGSGRGDPHLALFRGTVSSEGEVRCLKNLAASSGEPLPSRLSPARLIRTPLVVESGDVANSEPI